MNPDELAAFAAVPAPTGAEQARIAWLERRLRGLAGERVLDAAGNLIWRSSPDPPALLLLAHVDTVFGVETALAFERDGDRLTGPGVGDNAAAVLALVWELGRRGGPPPGVAVAFTVGEEGLGNLRGAIGACADLQPASVIAVEGHGLDEVVVEHVGSLRARVAVSGPGGHSWWDRGTPSAVHELIGLAAGVLGEGVNIGAVSGGGAVNAIAARAELVVERRSLEDADLETFGRRLGGLTVEPPLHLQVDRLGRRPAGRTDLDDPLVAAVRAARRSVGLGDRLGSGSTDANAAAAAGIPAVAIGCSRGSGMHTEHESIDLRSLETGCAQLGAILDRDWPPAAGEPSTAT